jgi:hypothetical protein
MKRSFSRVAIVNRGEAALRFIHAALELNREGERLRTIALYTEPDRHALFVREADEAWDLGPAVVEGADGRRKVGLRRPRAPGGGAAGDPGRGGLARLGLRGRAARLRRAVREARGHPSSARRPAAMRALGDKMASKRLAEGLGIPVVPWAGGPRRARPRRRGRPGSWASRWWSRPPAASAGAGCARPRRPGRSRPRSRAPARRPGSGSASPPSSSSAASTACATSTCRW